MSNTENYCSKFKSVCPKNLKGIKIINKNFIPLIKNFFLNDKLVTKKQDLK